MQHRFLTGLGRFGLPLLGVLSLFVSGVTRAQAPAQALLDELFKDHAVLQRDKPITVWGRTGSAEVVTVTLDAATVRAHADASGRWRATLPAMVAGGPFALTVQSSSGVRLSASDILLGDVFLCSGQSNMELSVAAAGDSRNEIANSANNTIRMLTVAHDSSTTPRDHFGSPPAWQSAAPDTVPEWSAVCFYYARELQKSVPVPIGLVQASWGGANIRPWMSGMAFKELGGYDSELRTLALYAKDGAAGQRQFAAQWETWWRAKSGDRVGGEPWNVSNADGASSTQQGAGDWQSAPAGLGDWRNWGVRELRDFTGLIWYRTHIRLTASQAKSAIRLDLGPINQVDETWINGKPLGNTFGYGTERSYALSPGLLHAGDNLLVVNVLSTYGGGGLLAGGSRRALRLSAGEPVPLEGPWQYRIAPAAIGYPPRAPWESVGGVTTLYNSMIAPLGPYGLRGVLWYQGESNTGEAQTYQALLAALMADWRRQFAPDLPFLIVQLPNYGPPALAPAKQSDWARLREAQRAAVANDTRAALAVTIDIGEGNNLHPTDKQDVGKRLARAARHLIYGESIAPSGPIALGAVRRGNEVAVEFGDIEGGLVASGHDSPIGFELCGDSAEGCRFAEATLRGSEILLEAPPGATPPTRVRYCWADNPVCTLFGRSGLPAGPFQLPIQPGATAETLSHE